MNGVVDYLRSQRFQSFSYDPDLGLFSVGAKKVALADLKPYQIPRAETELPCEYYESALFLAQGAMECVQMPGMTNWLQQLTSRDASGLQRKTVRVMQEVFSSYRKAHRELRATEIRNSFSVSAAHGLTDIVAGTDMIFAYTYCGDLVSEADMDAGYVEFHSNNLDDMQGDSIKVALLAGAGALAHHISQSS